MRPRKALLVVLLASLCASLGGGSALLVARAHADSPSPSPTATLSATAAPAPSPSASAAASPKLIAWASKWARLAGRNRRHLDRLRLCLGKRAVRAVPRQRTDWSAAAWGVYGGRCKRLDYRWCAEGKRDWRRIVAPKLVNVTSWRPCVRYFWPASLVSDCLLCIGRESGGRPRAVGPGGMCIGLMQESACWANLWHFDRACGWQNIKYGYQIWKRCGWSAWTTMRGCR